MKYFLVLLMLLCSNFQTIAKEENSVYRSGRKYINIRTNKLKTLNRRIEKQQQRWLEKLARKENKWLKTIKQKDSATFSQLTQSPNRFDSIKKRLHPDSLQIAKLTKGKINPSIDSLKKIERFLSQQPNSITNKTIPTKEVAKLNELQTQLNYRQYINSLIEQRNKELKNSSKKIPLPKGLVKEMYYGSSKVKALNEIANEPSKTETKALEVLQGTDGFDKAIGLDDKTGIQNANSVEELEKMGYQTKRMLSSQLQQKFGNNLGAIQQQMGNQVKEFQQQLGVNQLEKIKATKKEVQQNLSGLQQNIAQIKRTENPSFKINPMRGLPFRKRLEQGFSWNTTRSTPDGARPALMDMAYTIAFKHTPKLLYGVGIGTSIGLGQDWSHIQFTIEGIGFRTFANWQWQYGIGAYTGYEYMYGIVNLTKQKTTDQPQLYLNTDHKNESIFLGITKSYKLNSKWNGQMQLLYDVWWKEKGLMNPIVFRITTSI